MYPLSLLLYFLFKLLLPPPFASHWSARRTVAQATLNLLIAPFGLVRFKDAYLGARAILSLLAQSSTACVWYSAGDILTSMVKPLIDFAYVICFYSTGVFLDDSLSLDNSCTRSAAFPIQSKREHLILITFAGRNGGLSHC